MSYNSFMKSIQKCLTTLLAAISLFSPKIALAQVGTAWSGRCVSQGDVATIQGLECLFFNVLQVVAALAGLVFFFMFVSGGFKYLFSGGDDKKVAAAASSLTSAVIGLIGIIASWFVLQLIKNFTGVDVTNFVIPGP
jgi:hypothetical protein